jgi:hypothetical protein
MTPDERRALWASWPYATWYDCNEDRERLSHSDAMEAIEEALDGLAPAGGCPDLEELIRNAYPGGLDVHCWERLEVNHGALADSAVEAMADLWGDEYGDPDGDDDGDFEELHHRIALLVATHCQTHKPWRCEKVKSFNVPIETLVGLARLEWPSWFSTESAEDRPSGPAPAV